MMQILRYIVSAFLTTYVFLAMAAGLICCVLRHKLCRMTIPQALFLYFVEALFGNVGDRITARIALGAWGGGCWYGVPLMITASIFLLMFLMKRDYGSIGDMSAAGICCVHIVSKIACLQYGCCYGNIIRTDEYGIVTRFPCREFEIAAYTIILLVLLVFEQKHIAQGMLWELYIIWYAVIRYFAAWHRGIDIDWEPFFLWIPAARAWTIAIFITGFVILFFHFKKRYGRAPSVKELLCAAIGILPKQAAAAV